MTAAKSNLGDRVLGEVEKNTVGLFLCQTKGDTVGSYLTKTIFPSLGRYDDEFYSNVPRIGLLKNLGCVQGLHSFNLVSENLLMSFSGSLILVFP